jgi:hypothetical protein
MACARGVTNKNGTAGAVLILVLVTQVGRNWNQLVAEMKQWNEFVCITSA